MGSSIPYTQSQAHYHLKGNSVDEFADRLNLYGVFWTIRKGVWIVLASVVTFLMFAIGYNYSVDRVFRTQSLIIYSKDNKNFQKLQEKVIESEFVSKFVQNTCGVDVRGKLNVEQIPYAIIVSYKNENMDVAKCVSSGLTEGYRQKVNQISEGLPELSATTPKFTMADTSIDVMREKKVSNQYLAFTGLLFGIAVVFLMKRYNEDKELFRKGIA